MRLALIVLFVILTKQFILPCCISRSFGFEFCQGGGFVLLALFHVFQKALDFRQGAKSMMLHGRDPVGIEVSLGLSRQALSRFLDPSRPIHSRYAFRGHALEYDIVVSRAILF